MTDTLDTLVKRLEAAAFGGYALDCAIADAIGYRDCGTYQVRLDPFGKDDRMETRRSLPGWSTSLDAALTLVPEAVGWELVNFGDPRGAVLLVPGKGEVTRFGATPALALCIASLRARALPPPPSADLPRDVPLLGQEVKP